MDTKILRQKILDLAIHGRLVKQDANDEPASALLARIRAEKEQLVKDGKLKKKDLVTTPVSDEDKPFEVPEGWEWCRIQDICYVAAGSTPSKECFADEGIPYLKMYNLRNNLIDFEYQPQYVKEETHNGKLQRSRTEVGDIIMNIVGPPLGKVALIPSTLPQANFNQAAVLIRPLSNKEIIAKYIRYYLLEMSEINSISTKGSAGQDNISLTQSQQMRLPLPPLAEQQRIVAAVEQWMSLIDIIESGKENLQQSIALAKNKILDLAIKGKLVEKEGEWEEKTLGEVAFIRDNLRKPINSSERANRIAGKKEEELYPYYGATGQVGYIDEYLMDGNYILLGEDGAPFLDKFAAKAYAINGKCWVNNHAHVLEPKCEMQYLLHVLNITDYHVYAKGSTRLKLTQADMVKISIPLPPLSEQHRIVAKIEELFTQLDIIANALK